MSDSWPVKVCRHMLSLMSHSLIEASQAPDTKVCWSGERDRLMTSPVWPEKTVVCWLVSISHSALGKKSNDNNNNKKKHRVSDWKAGKRCLGCTCVCWSVWLTMWCLLSSWWFDCHQWNGNMTGNLRERNAQTRGWCQWHLMTHFTLNYYCIGEECKT